MNTLADDGKGLSTAVLRGNRPERGLPAGDQEGSGKYADRPDHFQPNRHAEFESHDQAGDREVVSTPTKAELAQHNPIRRPARRSSK